MQLKYGIYIKIHFYIIYFFKQYLKIFTYLIVKRFNIFRLIEVVLFSIGRLYLYKLTANA